mgnify:CR=1 FL=1|jgi:hypothetical protein
MSAPATLVPRGFGFWHRGGVCSRGDGGCRSRRSAETNAVDHGSVLTLALPGWAVREPSGTLIAPRRAGPLDPPTANQAATLPCPVAVVLAWRSQAVPLALNPPPVHQ